MTSLKQLGYVAFDVKSVAAWESFASGVLGMQLSSRYSNGALSFRIDEYAQRMFVEPGELDDLAAVGWETENESELLRTVERVKNAGHDIEEASREIADYRGVKRVFRFRDPGGVPTELFYGPTLASAPLASPVITSRFVAGKFGFGHLVLSTDDQLVSQRFYVDVLGFKLSDRIVADVYGYKADLSFFHTNGRHHSVALGAKQKKRLNHFMVEVESIDDVGLAFDRALKAGVKVTQTIGRHPNDEMFSFYAKTPSGFQFEFGAGGRIVDDATWKPTTYNHISEWGHHPPSVIGSSLGTTVPPAKQPGTFTGGSEPRGTLVEIGDRLAMHFHDVGVGPPVLFLHGSGPGASGWSNFRRNFPVIAEAGFRAVVPDTLGFGHSSKPETVDYSLEFLTACLKRFVDTTKIEQCAIVGNSHGGALAIQFALSHPERVSKLILMAPGGLEEREAYMKMEGIRAMIKAVRDPGGITKESLRRVLELQLFDQSLLTDDIVNERYEVAVTQPSRVMASLTVPFLAPELHRLEVPVLGLWGQDDKFCPVSGAGALTIGCKNSRVTLLSQCGHWVMVEHADYFNRACIEFLKY